MQKTRAVLKASYDTHHGALVEVALVHNLIETLALREYIRNTGEYIYIYIHTRINRGFAPNIYIYIYIT